MRNYLCSLLATGGLLAFAPGPTSAATTEPHLAKTPTEAPRTTTVRNRVAFAKNAATFKTRLKTRKVSTSTTRAMLETMGIIDNKSKTTHRKLVRHLHRHQTQLRVKTRQDSRTNQRHFQQFVN